MSRVTGNTLFIDHIPQFGDSPRQADISLYLFATFTGFFSSHIRLLTSRQGGTPHCQTL